MNAKLKTKTLVMFIGIAKLIPLRKESNELSIIILSLRIRILLIII